MFKHLISMILISVSLLLAGCGSAHKDAADSDDSIGVQFVDHIIVGDEDAASMRCMEDSKDYFD